MAETSDKIAVYLEIGKKRTIAGAVDWPGWCRVARDEGGALEALARYAPRYERVVRATGLSFDVPGSASVFTVVERLPGNMTTDFGAPDAPPSSDALPVDDSDLHRLKTILQACWSALDSAAAAAHGKELLKGPRGGGRDVPEIVRHVTEAEGSYLVRLGAKRPNAGDDYAGNIPEDLTRIADRQRRAVLDALGAAARGEYPMVGPRGGKRWTARFFVRRAAWHVLDHAWEIEDRLAG